MSRQSQNALPPHCAGLGHSGELVPPVSVLPEDVLEAIFLQCFLSQRTTEPRTPNFSSLTLSHVCQYWRQVALSSGRLWTFIHLSHPKVAQHYMFHSKLAPLYITGYGMLGDCPDEDEVVWLKPHASRISRIRFTMDTRQVNTFFETMDQGLPSLESLSISGYGHFSRNDKALSFALDAPRLHTLLLSHVNLYAPHFNDLLRQTQRLERLVLIGCDNTTATFCNFDPFHLHHLRECTLTNVCGVETLLNTLRLPPTVDLTVTNCEPTDLASVLNASARAYFKSHFCHTIMEFDLGRISTRSHTARGSFTYHADHLHPHCLTQLPAFGVAVFDWTSINALEINNAKRMDPGWDGDGRFMAEMTTGRIWATLFSLLPALSTITISASMPLEGMISALSLPSRDLPVGRHIPLVRWDIPCPSLRVLSFVDGNSSCALNEPGTDAQPGVGGSSPLLSTPYMLQFLRDRPRMAFLLERDDPTCVA